MKTILIALCFIPVAAMACKEPIIKKGTCPLGYYSSGGYCIPNR